MKIAQMNYYDTAYCKAHIVHYNSKNIFELASIKFCRRKPL